MVKLFRNIKINTTVCAIEFTDNNLYTLDSDYILNTFSLNNYSNLNKNQLIPDSGDRHIYDKSYAISNKLHIFTSNYQKLDSTLFLLKEDKLLKIDTFSFKEDAICISRFSNNNSLLTVGDEGGRVFFYDLDIKQLIFSFDPRADSISSISFSKEDKYCAVGSYDKSIIIYNIQSHKEENNIFLSDVVEDLIFIDYLTDVIGITRDKRIFFYDSEVDEIIYSDDEFEEWPSVIKELSDNYLLVGTRSNILYLINSDTLEISQTITLNNIGVKTLNIKDNNLYIGYIDGNIEIIDTTYLSSEFEAFLKNNKFEEATSLLEKNIFLLTNSAIKKYDEVWEQILDMAKTYLFKQDPLNALKIAKPFFFDPYKEEEYDFLTSNKNDIQHFNNLVKEQKVISAFKFADEHLYLKNTKEYNLLEQIWHKVFNTCKVLFEKNDLESSQKAIDTLKRYAGIPSKKQEIESLISNYKFFIRAHKLVKSKNFKLYHLLVEKKPFLTQDNLYKKVHQAGNQAYMKLIELEKNEEFEKANSLAKHLLDFTEFKDKANESIDSIGSKCDLLENINNNDINAVYDAIDNNQELENFKAYINYNKKFTNLKKDALKFAKDAKTKEVYKSLDNYLDVDYLINSIAMIFKLSYISEMQNNAKLSYDAIHWIETIKRYEKIYGLDNELKSFVKEFKLDELTNDTDLKTSFKNIDFYESILVYK